MYSRARETNYDYCFGAIDIFKHNHYWAYVEYGTSTSDWLLVIQRSPFPFNKPFGDPTRKPMYRADYRLTIPLTQLSRKNIYDIKVKFPREFRQRFFGYLIPYLYDISHRVRSNKYKELVPFYATAELEYSRRKFEVVSKYKRKL